MHSPLVTIIIPLYNCENYIQETLESLLNQTYNRWESIIVDDGSTDLSISIVKKIQKYDNRIFLYRRDRLPKGGSVCRNIGIAKARGKYVVFLDSDDLLSATCLENRIRLMEQIPSLDFGVFPMQTFTKSIFQGQLFSRLHVKNHLAHFIATDCIWQITSPIWKYQTLLRLNGFDENLPRLQDPNLHMRALMLKDINYKVFQNENVDCYYRSYRKKNHAEYSKKKFTAYFLHISYVLSSLEFFKQRHDYNTSLRPAFRWALISSFRHFWNSPVIVNNNGNFLLSSYLAAQPLKLSLLLYIKFVIFLHKIRVNKLYPIRIFLLVIHSRILKANSLE